MDRAAPTITSTQAMLDVIRRTAIVSLLSLSLSLASIVACRHTEGVKPLSVPRTVGALGTAPATGSLIIDVGASDVRLVMGEPQAVVASRVGTRDLRDSVVYALETTPAECAKADVSPGRIAETRRSRNCHARWTVRLPRTADVRVRASVGDVELVAPADRAIHLQTKVGNVRVTLDGREVQGGKSPGSGDEWRVGDLETLPRLDVRTGVGSIRAELKTTAPARPER